jgi:hypothetical protein
MSGDTNYLPGNSVHFIQARKALEKFDQWKAISLVRVRGGSIELQGVSTGIFRCSDTDRLNAVLDTGRVPRTSGGIQMLFLAPHNVLIVPCAEEQKIFSQSAPIHSSVVYIEDGAALWSPTIDGAWHLFSVVQADQSVSC